MISFVFSLSARADPLADEARAILDELLVVDTSHGHESDALRPIAARFEKAGVPVEIAESAPGRGNLIARLRGSGKKRPLLLLAHIDVVPVEGQPWTTSPFRPTEKEGHLYARGVGDDKSMAAAIVAVTLELARAGTPLTRDLIVALTAGEETGGDAGVRWLADRSRRARATGRPSLLDPFDAAIALNEGGPLLLTPDGDRIRYAGYSPAEKSYQSYTLVARGKGGHSSLPSPEADPVTPLARALVKVGELRFPAHILPSVKGYLALRASWEKPPLADALRRAAASAPNVSPTDDALLSAEPSVNNQIRTTCVATMLSASNADNVLPTTAKATVNCRLLPDETRDSTRAALARAIADPRIEVAPLDDIGISPASPVDGEVPDAIRKAAARLWPGAPVIPTMSAGATDSRHLRNAGILSYGISCAPLTLDDALKGRAAHGPDERRPLRWLPEGPRYLREIVRNLAEE